MQLVTGAVNNTSGNPGTNDTSGWHRRPVSYQDFQLYFETAPVTTCAGAGAGAAAAAAAWQAFSSLAATAVEDGLRVLTYDQYSRGYSDRLAADAPFEGAPPPKKNVGTALRAYAQMRQETHLSFRIPSCPRPVGAAVAGRRGRGGDSPGPEMVAHRSCH